MSKGTIYRCESGYTWIRVGRWNVILSLEHIKELADEDVYTTARNLRVGEKFEIDLRLMTGELDVTPNANSLLRCIGR